MISRWLRRLRKPGTVLELKAHAKVNLGLNVLRQRADGFHEVDTLMVKLELHDTVRLEPQTAGIDLETEGADLPRDRANLAFRAAEAYLQAFASNSPNASLSPRASPGGRPTRQLSCGASRNSTRATWTCTR
jgi:hypothetical protein